MKSLSKDTLQIIYFSVLLVIFGILSLTVLGKFIIVLSLAYVTTILLSPVHGAIEKFVRTIPLIKKYASFVSAALTVILLVILIITPLVLILGKVLSDAQGFYTNVTTGGFNLDVFSAKIQASLSSYIPNLQQRLGDAASAVSSFFIQNIGNFFSGTFDIILKVFLFLMSLFFFLKDKERFVSTYKDISPLQADDDEKIYTSIQTAVRSIMLGSIVVAIAQGTFTGIGFAMFGVPNPFFFGTIAAFFALVPGIGPAIVWIPGAIYLYATGAHGGIAWIGQVIWGLAAVGLIDNILGPFVVKKGIQVHQLFILLSVIGGISVFGPEGFLFGPLILSIFTGIASVWRKKMQTI